MTQATFGAKILKEDKQWYLEYLTNEVRQLRELLAKGNWRELTDRVPHLRGARCYGFPEVAEQGKLAVEACLKMDRTALEQALAMAVPEMDAE